MKLRLDGHSIRLRLSKSEVALIGAGNSVSETVRLGLSPSEEISYELRVDSRAEKPSCSFEDRRIMIVLPPAAAHAWAGSPETGIYAGWDDGAGGEVQLLIEKDFKCLHDSAEANEDRHENPGARRG